MKATLFPVSTFLIAVIILSGLFFGNLAKAEQGPPKAGAISGTGAGAKPAEKPKSQFNANIFEKESTESTIATTVKLVREVQGETQVFLEGQQGFFSLASNNPNAGAYQNLLIDSQKKRTQVSVTLDPLNRQILKVTHAGE